LESTLTEKRPILSPEALALWQTRGLGPLAEKMGIELVELSAEHAIATMPVDGNTQPLGLVHGGAFVVIAESLGSLAANVWAGEGRFAVGIEVNASHTRSAREGLVTATATAIHLGGTLTVHEVVMRDSADNRLSTVRITNLIRSR
jgi:uncharacterized protein (TIGR00369 family)